MVYQIELETTVSITEFINVEGQLFFSKDAFHSVRKIKPDILFRRTFILKNTDGKNYCCYHDDKTIYIYRFKNNLFDNIEKRKENRRGLICKSREIQQAIKDWIIRN